jgi:hypothetical protein
MVLPAQRVMMFEVQSNMPVAVFCQCGGMMIFLRICTRKLLA